MLLRENPERGRWMLLELLNTLVQYSHTAMESRIKIAAKLRGFADEQEKLSRLQLGKKKKALGEDKRKKSRALGRFRSLKQQNMVDIVTRELAELEEKGQAELVNSSRWKT